MLTSRSKLARFSRLRLVICVACLAGVLGACYCFWKDVCYWRADAALWQRRTDDAAVWVKRSQWLGPSSSADHCLLQLRIARRQQNFTEVERLLREAVVQHLTPREVQRERLLAMAQTNQFKAMEGHWKDLLNDQRDDGPEIARAYYTWAMLNHNVNLAEKTLKLWQQDYPLDAEPWALNGRYHQSMNNWEGAEEAYQKAVMLAPESDELRLALANILQIRLKADKAISLYRKHLQKHPGSVEALQGLAQCLATKGDMEAAIGVLRDALDANPEDFTTQKLYGEILLSSGDPAAAIPVLEKAHRAVPEHANLAYALGRALKEVGRGADAEPLIAFMEESRPHLDQLLKLERELRTQPENLNLRMEIASTTAKYVSRRDAIRWYENLLIVSPSYIPAHRELADLYHQLGDQQLADYHSKFVSPKVGKTNPVQASSPRNPVPNDATSVVE